MGLLNKLKNVFFEEEYVEVEEEVKPKKEKPVAVAKKIELPESKKVEEEVKPNKEVETFKEPAISIEEQEKKEANFKFPMEFDDADFRADNAKREPNVVEVSHIEVEVNDEPAIQEQSYVGLYEGRETRKTPIGFRPSPIISPIYGVLDKNYKKEEIITKKEIRLSSASNKKIDFDAIREKAYGDLTTEITSSILDEPFDNVAVAVEEEETMNLLYDLNEEDKPAVSKVTVGDAEEYFSDLGLEYNVDYADHSREIATGRRTRVKSGLEEVEPMEEEEIENNLFDLIDSMYEDKE